jgi:dihydroorotate dehydrogenase (NAD+) catalytic subunit
MLGIDFLGYKLKNPLMLTEGPLSGTESLLKKASESEAGLIFTKGIRLEEQKSPVPFMKIHKGSLFNADWSCIGMERWLEIIERLEIETPLVVSIAKNYVSPETAVSMAERLVKAGAKIISFVDYNPNQLVKTIKLARPVIKVPIMVKLTPFLSDLEEHLKTLVDSGIDGIAAMDSIGPVLSIDTKTGAPVLGSTDGSGYISGKSILSVTLKYIYEISRFVDIPVVGVGGVTDTDSALQMIMAGATGVGMVTSPMIKGLKQFKKISDGLKHYLFESKTGDINGIRGLTHSVNKVRDVSTNFKAVISKEKCNNCGACNKVCYSNAISVESDWHIVNKVICIGCGLCSGVCSEYAIFFR